MSKNNKPYGFNFRRLQLFKEIRLFGDNYIKFRNYFIQGIIIFSSMVNRSWDGNLVMKINNVVFYQTFLAR